MFNVTARKTFLSTPSARRATYVCRLSWHSNRHFYPRPPRGGRRWWLGKFPNFQYFYPRPPRGGRLLHLTIFATLQLFLSTPSARRATYAGRREGGQWTISIHALREEGDYTPRLNIIDICDFYPRPPRGGRLPLYPFFGSQNNFYPRPPRGGRRAGHGTERAQKDFYPRPPRGGRHPGILPQSA